jgi:hypothetical protein
VVDEAAVDRAARELREAGVEATEPRYYPEYAPDYYATFFEDPDGMRLVGSVLLEQHDEWQVSKRYFSAGSLAKLNRGEERMAEQPQLVAS